MNNDNTPPEPDNTTRQEDGQGLDDATCSPTVSTLETDGWSFNSWVWDTHYMDYRPSCKVVKADFARQLEQQRNEARRLAEHWRNIAAGTFAGAAPLPWENAKTLP